MWESSCGLCVVLLQLNVLRLLQVASCCGALRHTASLSLISLETDTVQLPAFRLLYSSLYLTATAAPARRSDARNIPASKCLIAREDKIYTLPAQTLLHVFPLFPFYTPLSFLQKLWHASSCICTLCLRSRLAKEKNEMCCEMCAWFSLLLAVVRSSR